MVLLSCTTYQPRLHPCHFSTNTRPNSDSMSPHLPLVLVYMGELVKAPILTPANSNNFEAARHGEPLMVSQTIRVLYNVIFVG